MGFLKPFIYFSYIKITLEFLADIKKSIWRTYCYNFCHRSVPPRRRWCWRNPRNRWLKNPRKWRRSWERTTTFWPRGRAFPMQPPRCQPPPWRRPIQITYLCKSVYLNPFALGLPFSFQTSTPNKLNFFYTEELSITNFRLIAISISNVYQNRGFLSFEN